LRDAGGTVPAGLIWAALVLAVAVPLTAAAGSPLLAWRQPVHIAAGFAGVLGLSALLVQPMLIGGFLPGLSPTRARHLHRWTGSLLALCVVPHVAGLWITSPPDVIDALTFTSPTPFSAWGVIAMWAVFATAFLAALRRRPRPVPRTWRRAHTALAVVIVIGSVVHALLIEGTMERLSKAVLCLLVVAATAKTLSDLRRRTRA